ncbi:MAG: hypothetical protein HY319_04090 [Armatimonadetes bacterium]|nr:hypothetical protein [Armatimonadota bacterium]
MQSVGPITERRMRRYLFVIVVLIAALAAALWLSLGSGMFLLLGSTDLARFLVLLARVGVVAVCLAMLGMLVVLELRRRKRGRA